MTNSMSTVEIRLLAWLIEDRTLATDDIRNLAADAIRVLVDRVEVYEVGLLAKLRAIRAKTGNPLFDAGIWDACDKIETFIAALNAKDVTP